jgi:CRISPR-associated protein Cmr2
MLAVQYDADMNSLEQEKQNFKKDKERIKKVNQIIRERKTKLIAHLNKYGSTPSDILASGVIDFATAWWFSDLPRKNDIQDGYIQLTKKVNNISGETAFSLPDFLDHQWPTRWMPAWFGIEVAFTLTSPWYSKDDRPFHVLDNPVRKDRVFGVPFMSAAAWKGLLRWAYGMQTDLVGPCLESDEEKVKKAKKQITHLFGNEKGAAEEFRSGALVCYPTWFSKVGFEVINPHKRGTRAGTQPIFYEVVPADTKGTLRLLHAPLPGEIERNTVTTAEIMDKLIDSIQALLETYGISAKRTAGWGAARIDTWKGFSSVFDGQARVESQPKKNILHSLQDIGALGPGQDPSGSFTSKNAKDFKAKMTERLATTGGTP